MAGTRHAYEDEHVVSQQQRTPLLRCVLTYLFRPLCPVTPATHSSGKRARFQTYAAPPPRLLPPACLALELLVSYKTSLDTATSCLQLLLWANSHCGYVTRHCTAPLLCSYIHTSTGCVCEQADHTSTAFPRRSPSKNTHKKKRKLDPFFWFVFVMPAAAPAATRWHQDLVESRTTMVSVGITIPRLHAPPLSIPRWCVSWRHSPYDSFNAAYRRTGAHCT